MKKILSALLVVAMLASMFAVLALPTAAIDGQFDTHGRASHEEEGYDGDKGSIPGYEYTPDGFKMTTADWTTGRPFSHMSTKEKVDLKNGVYMQVRVDTFSYDADDRWFNFNIWSKPTIDEGSGDSKWGYGVQTLIKLTAGTAEKHGTLNQTQWKIKQFNDAGTTNFDDAGKAQVEGKNVLTLVVTYDPQVGYGVSINGVSAPQKVLDYMNETYADDSQAYIGFTLYSNKSGGEQSATILAFGENEATATKPMGNDSKPAENHIIKYVDMMDESTVAEGQPAIIMTGDKANSQLKGTPASVIGSLIAITDENLVKVVGTNKKSDCGIWNVKNDSSYNIQDFPVVLCLVKNFCSCGAEPGECFGFESANVHICTGDEIGPGNNNQVTAIDSSDPYFITNDDGSIDNYIYFYYDTTYELKGTDEDGNEVGRFDGRINATRFDFEIDLLTPGANEFEVVMQCFFRSVEDAEAYMDAYLASQGWTPDDGDDETDAPTDTETDPQETDPQETNPQETNPQETEPQETDKQTEPGGNAGDNTSSGGCFGTVGFGAIAIITLAAGVGFVTFKKKK